MLCSPGLYFFCLSFQEKPKFNDWWQWQHSLSQKVQPQEMQAIKMTVDKNKMEGAKPGYDWQRFWWVGKEWGKRILLLGCYLCLGMEYAKAEEGKMAGMGWRGQMGKRWGTENSDGLDTDPLRGRLDTWFLSCMWVLGTWCACEHSPLDPWHEEL